MPLLSRSKKSKGGNKKRKSSGDSASSPVGPASEQAGPALVEKIVEVVAKASIQSDDPESLDAEKSASPNRSWTLKHAVMPEIMTLMPKELEFCFVFRDEYRQKGENTDKRQIFYSCRRKIAHEMEEINRRCSSSSGLCRFIFQLRWAFQNL